MIDISRWELFIRWLLCGAGLVFGILGAALCFVILLGMISLLFDSRPKR